jgi:hypothetical protein
MKVTCYDLWTTRTLVSKIFHVVVLDIEFLRVVVFLDNNVTFNVCVLFLQIGW